MSLLASCAFELLLCLAHFGHRSSAFFAFFLPPIRPLPDASPLVAFPGTSELARELDGEEGDAVVASDARVSLARAAMSSSTCRAVHRARRGPGAGRVASGRRSSRLNGEVSRVELAAEDGGMALPPNLIYRA